MRKPLASLFVMVFFVTAGALGAIAQTQAPASAQPTGAGQHVMVLPDQIKWGPAPPSLPSGAQAAIMDGDPATAGMFTIRVKFPDGYAVPPHWHPTDEYVTVLSGSLMVGLGDKAEASAMHAMAAGAFAKMPRRTNHYVRAKGDTSIQIHGMGPFEVNYVNPADDPRKKTTTK